MTLGTKFGQNTWAANKNILAKGWGFKLEGNF